MESVLIILAVLVVMFIIAILAKTRQQHDENNRKAELLRQIVEHYDGLPESDACDVFYVSIMQQMYRSKYQGANYEQLQRDAQLVIDIRNSFIEEDVIRQIETPLNNGIFPVRRPASFIIQHS